MRIAVAGIGYVGLSNAVLLAQHHKVTAVGRKAEKIDMVNRGVSPIVDRELSDYLSSSTLYLTATADASSAYNDAEFVIIATPTDYDPQKNFFDTSSVDSVIELVQQVNPEAVIVIKSTVPVGVYRQHEREVPGDTPYV